MKKFKKLVAVMLAAIMVMAMGTSVFADTTNGGGVITITNVTSDQHTFTAYQVFNATYDNTSGKLSNIEWGSNIDEDNLYALLQALDSLFGTSNLAASYNASNIATSAAAVAAALEEAYKTDSDIASKFADVITTLDANDKDDGFKYLKGTGTASGTPSGSGTSYTYTIGTDADKLSDGYYVIADTIASGSTATNDIAADYLVQIVNSTSVNMTYKVTVPSIDKSIVEGSTTQNTNEASYGETVNYQIKITVPSDIKAYTNGYTIKVTDTLSDGLSYNVDADGNLTIGIEVYESSTAQSGTSNVITATKVDSSYVYSTASNKYDCYYYIDGQNLYITFQNLLTTAYDSTPTYFTGGEIIYLTYSAVVGDTSTVSVGTGTGNGNTNTVVMTYSNNPNSEGVGTSTEEKVTTYVTKIAVDKYDYNNTKLAGAEFTLYELVSSSYVSSSISDIENGTYYYYDSTNDAMVLITASNESRLDDVKVYEKTTTLTTASSGNIEFTGLGAGTYMLVETSVPSGYLEAGPFKIVITYDTTDAVFKYEVTDELKATTNSSVKTNLATGTGAQTSSATDGTLTLKVTNFSADATIPTTGGMGTTILYIIGAILVIGAAVILVTRRRMANK